MSRFAELRCRTHYSFLRGASHPSELVERAVALGLEALAITDRDGVYGMPKAYQAIRDLPPESRLKLLVGTELTLADRPRLTLIATDRAGYGLMCRLITASHEGKPKGSAALEWERFLELMERPGRRGLIALPEEMPSGDWREDYAVFRDLFEDRLYLPLSRVLDGRDQERTEWALSISRSFGAPIIASNDVHYHVADKRRLQDVLTSIRENVPLEEAGFKLFSNGERYLKSARQMATLFQDLPDAVSRTCEISGRCTFSPSELRYRYPSEWIPASETAQTYLKKLTWKGAESRYPTGIPEDVTRQLKHELGLIEELQFADYFLTIWEVVEFARGRGILCQGRGSAANSAVCYCLGITAIDPVRMNLLFERFISVERGEPPDIDVDFEHERREEVIQHIYEKYGRDRAGMVAAVITYRSRSSLRDIGKALGVSAEQVPEDLLGEIRGFPRHLSIHSGGFTLSADPIIETVPIEPARMEGRTIVQWDKDDLATIGLLKVDILALGMLTAIQRTFDLIRPRAELTVATVPAEDPATYEMIRKADTVGVFQIESRAQMNMLQRLRPQNFYDLVIEVAIVRPGPIVGQMVHPYLKRRRGLESSASPDPRLEPILARTLGVPLFQEQVMKMAIAMADFTPGEADQLRRAIGAWRSSGTIEKMGRKLMEGFLRNGLPQEFVERVFQQIQGFAEYGFPESHAASFALLAYASSYLKCHYPAEFTCALLNSQPMGFYSSHTLVEDARRHGVSVLPVHPRFSDWDCTIEDGALRLGWRMIHGLGRAEADRILEARKTRAFDGLADFIARTGLSVRSLNTLAMGDVFAAFGLSQREALWRILASRNIGEADSSGQLNLFYRVSADRERGGFRGLSEFESIRADYESYGLSVRGHPMQALRMAMGRRIPPLNSRMIKRSPQGRMARVAGMIIARQRPSTAKGTVFATLEDEEGFVDLILHEKIFEKYHDVFVSDPFLVVTGTVQTDGHAMNLIVRKVQPLAIPEEYEMRVRSHDFH